jgi:hypothetical protein
MFSFSARSALGTIAHPVKYMMVMAIKLRIIIFISTAPLGLLLGSEYTDFNPAGNITRNAESNY